VLRLILLTAALLAASALPVSARTTDTVVTMHSATPSIAVGQTAFFGIGGHVDAPFPGGEVDVHWHLASTPCAGSPGMDPGKAPATGAVTPVAAGPANITTNGDTVSFAPPAAGIYSVCAWLVDTAGQVDAAVSVSLTATKAAGAPKPVPGWNPRTAACASLTRAEVAKALGVPSVKAAGGLDVAPTQTLFERANASACLWQGPAAAGSPTAHLHLVPESAPATLTRLLAATRSGPLARCRRVSGIGAAACTTKTGFFVVQKHLGVGLTMQGPANAGLIHLERQLVTKVLTRVSFAKK
jgi:hypothetical protein